MCATSRCERCGSCEHLCCEIEQVGSNVVATGSGAFDLTGLALRATGTFEAGITPSTPGAGIGLSATPNFPNTFSDFVYSGISGPTSFGSGGNILASSSSGPEVLLLDYAPFGGFTLWIPQTYSSGTLLASSQDIFDNQTLASLGITPGTYTWTWDNGANSFTITTTPLPAALPLFATGLGGLGLLGWRRKKKASSVAVG